MDGSGIGILLGQLDGGKGDVEVASDERPDALANEATVTEAGVAFEACSICIHLKARCFIEGSEVCGIAGHRDWEPLGGWSVAQPDMAGKNLAKSGTS